MIQAAVKKLQAELQANPALYLQVIGEYLIRHVTAFPETAENILPDVKTISGAFQEIAAEARRRVIGNERSAMVSLTDAEGFEIVLAYYGIDGDVLQDVSPVAKVPEQPVKAGEAVAAKPKQKKPAKKVVQFPGNEHVQTTLDDFLSESEVTAE